MVKEPIIEIKNLVVEFGSETILDDISFEVDRSEILTVMGGSGCGKSTLLRAIMRLIPVKSGEIVLNGFSTSGLSESQMNKVRKDMGLVFQEGALFDSMTVFENVAFPLRRHTSMRESEIRTVVRERLEAVEMDGQEKKYPDELSGGMQRRVAIARAMSLSPKILLYDEPTTGLDPLLTETVVKLILKMRDQYGATSLVVTHDMAAARAISDRAVMLHDRKIAAIGTLDELANGDSPYARSFMGAHNGAPH